MAAAKTAKSSSWQDLSKKEAWKLVLSGELYQDLFEDFFQITERDLEDLKND